MSIGFRLYFEDQTVFVSRDGLKGRCRDGGTVYVVEVHGARVTWRFTPYAGGELVVLDAYRYQYRCGFRLFKIHRDA